MTTQVLDGIKEQLMKSTKTVKSRSTRAVVDKSVDIKSMVQYLRSKGPVSKLEWESFKGKSTTFRHPLSCVCAQNMNGS